MVQAVFESSELGARLSALREELGYSQTELASRLGISLRAYQSYERAERELPLTVAITLFRELGINPIWLALGTGSGSKRLLTPDEAARLCAELHETWQQALDALPVDVSGEVSKPIYRRLSRSAFREAAVPHEEINEVIEDLKP